MYAAAPSRRRSTEGEHARRLSKPQPAVVAVGRVPHGAGREAAAVAETGLQPKPSCGLAEVRSREAQSSPTLALIPNQGEAQASP